MKYLLVLLPMFLFSSNLIEQIKQHEGYSKYIYKDSGHYSIGYGTNLAHGLTEDEAELLLIHRISKVQSALEQHIWFKRLSKTRQDVLLNMGYQLGISGLFEFKHMIWRLKQGYYKAAANSMKDSKWYKQSGNRAKQLVRQMIKG